MHLSHRISEDLDLLTHSAQLPRASINGLVRILSENGFTVERNDDAAAYEEFLIAGKSLHDYQQDFLVDGVKVSLLTPISDIASMVAPSSEPIPRVASLREIFGCKTIASADRCVSRDWLDLYVMFRDCGFTLADFRNVFHGVLGPDLRISIAFQNLCRGSRSLTDPGYEALMENPPSLKEISEYFSHMRAEYETTATIEAFKRASTNS